jgi:hypothetical protein
MASCVFPAKETVLPLPRTLDDVEARDIRMGGLVQPSAPARHLRKYSTGRVRITLPQEERMC